MGTECCVLASKNSILVPSPTIPSVPPNSKTEHDINVSLQQAYRQLLADDDILHKEFRLTIDTKDFPKKGGFLAAQALKKQQQQQQQDVSKQSDQSVADSTAGSVSAVEVKNGWQQLGLLYTPTWPLHLLFTPKILRQLDAVFRWGIFCWAFWRISVMANLHASKREKYVVVNNRYLLE